LTTFAPKSPKGDFATAVRHEQRGSSS